MKNKSLKSIISAVILTVMVGALAGCSSSSEDSASPADTSSPKAGITGSITASGSTALQPLAEEAAKLFQEKNTKATITVQ
ncbi:MAG: phosphate ABC transporter substrate-binding protein, partial [Clostridiaceae bacterium]|nr:phosphate ABC transporter substrate-binding protein [Clostridiaceae bacterium]